MKAISKTSFKIGQKTLKFHKFKKKKKSQDFGKDTIKHEIGANLPIIATLLTNKLLMAKSRNISESIIPVLAKAVKPMAKQALVWGLGSALGTKFTQSKKRKQMTPEERKKARKALLITGGLGALAGAVGAVV